MGKDKVIAKFSPKRIFETFAIRTRYRARMSLPLFREAKCEQAKVSWGFFLSEDFAIYLVDRL